MAVSAGSGTDGGDGFVVKNTVRLSLDLPLGDAVLFGVCELSTFKAVAAMGSVVGGIFCSIGRVGTSGCVFNSLERFEEVVDDEYVEGLGFVVKNVRNDRARLMRGLGCATDVSGIARDFPLATAFRSFSHFSVGTEEVVDSTIRARGRERYAAGGGAVADRTMSPPLDALDGFNEGFVTINPPWGHDACLGWEETVFSAPSGGSGS